jgi:hypothetical protein
MSSRSSVVDSKYLFPLIADEQVPPYRQIDLELFLISFSLASRSQLREPHL